MKIANKRKKRELALLLCQIVVNMHNESKTEIEAINQSIIYWNSLVNSKKKVEK